MHTSEYINQRVEDGILVLTLNRPEKRNAFTGDMYRALSAALNEAAATESIQVVLLTANGDYFCAGNDTKSFAGLADIPYHERPGFNFMNTLAQFPKLVVAALPGDAVGIGVTLLLHCDLVYLCRGSRLLLPFLSIGLVPEFASSLLLPQRLGYQRTIELLFLRQQIDAEEARAMGLANAVLEPNDLVGTAMQSCRSLTQLSAVAVAHSKRLLKQSQLPDIVERIEQETLAINALLTTMTLGKPTSTDGRQDKD